MSVGLKIVIFDFAVLIVVLRPPVEVVQIHVAIEFRTDVNGFATSLDFDSHRAKMAVNLHHLNAVHQLLNVGAFRVHRRQDGGKGGQFPGVVPTRQALVNGDFVLIIAFLRI